MKTNILLFFVVIFVACEKNEFTEIDTSSMKMRETKSLSATKSELDLMKNFGKGLAKLLKESEAARHVIKKEAIKKINYDYDVLYDLIKDEIIENGESFENALLRYVDESDLYQLKEIIPALTIFVPELPEDSFSADIWDATNEIPNVAIRCKDSDGVTAYTGDGEEYIIEAKYIPGYPIVVVKENERIIANHLSTKSSTTVIQNPNSNLTFMFTDEAFNNLTHKVTLRGSPTSEPIPEKLAKSYEAYSIYQTRNDGWQRDYIYYDITPSSPRGPFNYNYKEYLCSFEMLGDPVEAYKKISDGSDEPKFIPQGPNPGGGRAICWTDGEFEFKVIPTIAPKPAIGNIQPTSFRAKPKDLFNTRLEKVSSGGQVSYIVNDIYGLNRISVDLPLFEWDIENYSPIIRIRIEEIDSPTKITETHQTTTEFAANFEFNATTGSTDKVGLKFGSSAKEVRTTTYTTERNDVNDELGEVNINFGDPVLISDQPIVYTDPRRGDKTYYPQFNPKYYTGWYKIEVAPLKVYK